RASDRPSRSSSREPNNLMRSVNERSFPSMSSLRRSWFASGTGRGRRGWFRFWGWRDWRRGRPRLLHVDVEVLGHLARGVDGGEDVRRWSDWIVHDAARELVRLHDEETIACPNLDRVGVLNTPR